MAVVDNKEFFNIDEDGSIEKEKNKNIDFDRIKAQEELALKKMELQQQAQLEKERLLDERRKKDEEKKLREEERKKRINEARRENKEREKAEKEAKERAMKQAKERAKEEKAQADYEKFTMAQDIRKKLKADVYRKKIEKEEKQNIGNLSKDLGIENITGLSKSKFIEPKIRLARKEEFDEEMKTLDPVRPYTEEEVKRAVSKKPFKIIKQEAKKTKLIPSKKVIEQKLKETGIGIKEGLGNLAEKFKKKVYMAPEKTKKAVGKGFKVIGTTIASKVKEEAGRQKALSLYRRKARMSAQKMKIKREELVRAGLRRPSTISRPNRIGNSIGGSLFKQRTQSRMPTMKIFEPRQRVGSSEPRRMPNLFEPRQREEVSEPRRTPKIFEPKERQNGNGPIQIFGSTRNGMSTSKIFNPNRQGGLSLFEFKKKKRNKK